MNKFLLILAFLLLYSCRQIVTTFEETEDANYYVASSIIPADFTNSLRTMTWNIRFGASRVPWFGDSCGDRVLMTETEVLTSLNSIINFINNEKPDILLIQEIDIASKRSKYINQLQYILDHTEFNYGVYGSMWDAELIPSDGLGSVNVGNAILSRWELSNAKRIQLPLRTDQDNLTQHFYLRRNILKAQLDVPNLDTTIYIINIHATAFATDDTKQKHINQYKEILDDINNQNHIFITGGDLNSIPPNATITDYCEKDQCENESFHNESNGGPHREGSYFENFTDEKDLIQPFYDNFHPAIKISDNDKNIHFTHSTWNTNYSSLESNSNYWDRKLDYLFTNYLNGFINGTTHQDVHQLSDHAPVSATILFEN